ncbi:MAG: GNAT family N-acetyltransferase [Parvibaculum sp.]|nr:GNAT family N-acetyltransferase [Parvibaculum sp.]
MTSEVLPQPFRRIGGTISSRLGDVHLAGVVRGAAFVMSIRIVGAAIALLSQVFLARWMGAFEYGIFVYVWVWVVVLGIVVPMGFGTSVLRFVPEYRTKERWRRLAGLLRASFFIVFALGIVTALAGISIVWALRGHIESYYVLPLVVALVCVPGFALMDWQEGTARAFGWVNLAYIPSYIVRPLGTVIFAGGILFFTGHATGLQVTFGALGATVLTLIGQRILLARRVARSIPVARPIFHVRHWVAISAPLVLVEGLFLLLTNTDIVLLGYFVDPDSIGVYFAATRIANLMGFIGFSLAALAVPKFAELHGAGKHAELQTFVQDIIQWIFWPTLAAAIVLLAAGDLVLGLFGDHFGAGYPLLWLLVLGFLARAATGPTEYLLNMTGHQNAVAYAYGSAAVANVALNFALVPAFGLMGAAASTAISIVGATVWLAIIVHRRLGITAFVLAGLFRRSPAMPLEAAACSLHGQRPCAEAVVLESADALVAFRTEIEALAVASRDRNPQFETVALSAAMEHLQGRVPVKVALLWSEPVSDGTRLLIGLLPYQVVRGLYGLPFPVWRVWQHIHSFIATPLLCAGYEQQAIRGFLALADRSGAAFVQFPLFEAEGAFDMALDEVVARQQRHCHETDRHERAFLQSNLDEDAYVATHIRKKKRKEFSRLWNRLADLGALEFNVHDGGPDVAAWAGAFLSLEAGGWKGKRGTAMKLRANERAYFEAICLGAHKNGELHCSELTLNGEPIAMLASFRSGEGVYTFKIAFDEDHSKYSPGTLLMLKVAGAFLSDPRVAWADSCAMPGHPMIDHLWAQRRAMRSVLVTSAHPLSHYSVLHAASAIKLAMSARARLRKFYNKLRP